MYNGDALDVLRMLPDQCVNHVVTDPPYGQTNESYDPGIAFDPAVWRECFRVAKPDAALIAFAGSPTYHRIASAIEAGGWKVRQMWAWVYRDGMITSAWPKEGFDRLASAMDPIVYATKGKVLLSLAREGGSWECWGGRTGNPISTRAQLGRNTKGEGHWPRSVVCTDGVDGFQFFALSRGADRVNRTGHPNQKPLPLLEWLVSKLPPGGTVLDPFMGSGTTGVACFSEGFGFVGIEQDPDYHAAAERRIAAARAAAPLFA